MVKTFRLNKKNSRPTFPNPWAKLRIHSLKKGLIKARKYSQPNERVFLSTLAAKCKLLEHKLYRSRYKFIISSNLVECVLCTE